MAANADVQAALDRFHQTRRGYNESEEFYKGTRPEVFSSLKMRRALARSGTKFRVNFACTPVDVVLNRLEIKSVQVVGDAALSTLVEQIWTDNQLDLEAPDIHRWALVYGEDYVMVWPSDDSTDDAPAVDICYNSPLTTQLFYDVENPRKKRYAAKRWTSGDDSRLNLMYADRIEKYIAAGKKTTNDAADYQPYYDDDNDDGLGGTSWPLPNPYGKVPVFHYRTERPNGRPEHANAFGPQDMINKIVANQMAAGDFAAAPQRYALSDAASNDLTDFADASDDFPYTNPLDGDGSLEQERSNLTASPGTLWDLIGVKAVGEFAAADPDNFLKPFAAYVRAMAATCSTPIFHFEGMGDPPSGESLRVVEAPVNKKVVTRQGSFGQTHNEMLQFALEILGHAGVKVQTNWTNPATYDDSEFWITALQKVAIGVPLEQVLTEAGYDPDDAKKWAADFEKAQKDKQQTQAEAAAGAALTGRYNALKIDENSISPEAFIHPKTPIQVGADVGTDLIRTAGAR